MAVNDKFSHTQESRMCAPLLSSEYAPADPLKSVACRTTNNQHIVGVELANHLRAVGTGLVDFRITHHVERTTHGKIQAFAARPGIGH